MTEIICLQPCCSGENMYNLILRVDNRNKSHFGILKLKFMHNLVIYISSFEIL